MRKWIVAVSTALFAAAILAGCSHKPEEHARRAEARHQHEHEHAAVHEGCMNAIVTCENGHAEVKLDGDTLQVWFVGGGPDTDKSVRIPDKTIGLNLKTGKGVRTLVLNPKPLELAGEKVGDCSHFEGRADWLRGLKEFTATAQITFRGGKTPLRIEYPEGYDPD